MSNKNHIHIIFISLIFAFLSNSQKINAQSELYDITKIQEIRIHFYESNWSEILDSLFMNFGEDKRLVCDIYINGKSFPKAGIRYKGYSSFDSTQMKNPFNIDLNYTYKHLNYQGNNKIRLANVIYDPSFVREVVAYNIAQKYMPASQANFAKVYVDDYYLGLYTNVETVSDDFTEKYFKSKGNSFFKGSPAVLQYPFGQNSNLAYTHGSDYSGYLPYYKLESDYYGWNDLFNLIYILNNDTSNIPKVLNIDRTLWMHAFNYAILNLDSYIGYSQNYYLYKDNYGIFNTIPWDLNMSFGSFRNTDDISLSLSIDKIGKLDPLQHLYSNAYTPRPLMKNLFRTPLYRKMYIAHLRTIIKENIENSDYFNLASQLQNLIDSAVYADTNKFYTYSDFKNNLTVDAGTTSNKIPGIKSLMDARLAYLLSYPGFSTVPVISDMKYEPTIVEQNKEVWIKAKITNLTSAFLYSRNNSKAPFNLTVMYDDGLHHDEIAGDGIYGAQLTVNGKTLQYYIWAENDSCGSFSPERAANEFYEIQPQLVKGDVVINEIKLNAGTGYASENAGSWIELFNNTNEDFRLKNIYFSNDSLNRFVWKLKDTIIPSKNYLILGINNSLANDSLNINFSLPEADGKLYITYENGKEIDAVSYKQLAVNLSLGRYPNGNGNFNLMYPSFAAYNLYPKSENVSFYIYPNPTTGLLNYELNAHFPSVKIEIFNTLSQSIFNKEYTYDAAAISTYNTIDISSFPKGVYVVKASWADNSEIKKIIKQ
ncbi:MAG: CotH kinase family protein [Bacteroidetes bacterium]|nr:CotH kinase family protein [Bacteroidota bacterium]